MLRGAGATRGGIAGLDGDLEAVAALYHPDVTYLVFDDAGLVIEQRDTRNQARGRLPPPEGRGR